MDAETLMSTLRYAIEYFDIRDFFINNPPLRIIIIMVVMAVMGIISYLLCTFIHKKLLDYISKKYQKEVKSAQASSRKINIERSIDDAMFADLIKRTRQLLYLFILAWGLKQLVMGPRYDYAVSVIFITICTYVVIRFAISFVTFNIDIYLRKRGTTLKSSQSRSVMPIIKGMIWAVGLTFLLDNLGCHVSTIIAGLGIVGVAVGLAGQAILADFFSYLVLLIDKPFSIGDFIVLPNGKSGEIEYMGPKTTRLRSLEGNLIVCANSEMTKGVIVNEGSVEEREVVINIGVAYTVPMPIVQRVPEVMREVVESFPQCKFERACMLNFGPENYLFQLIYRVLPQPGGLTAFMATQSELNLALTQRMNTEKMGGAYPTEQILLSHVAAPQPTPQPTPTQAAPANTQQ